MAQFRSVPMRELAERLGPAYTRRVYGSGTSGHICWLMWTCNGEEDLYDSCRAINRGEHPLTSDPAEGWELTTCSRHGELFSDFPSANDE